MKAEPSREPMQCCMWDMVETWVKAEKFWCYQSPNDCLEPLGVADIEDSQLEYILYIKNFLLCRFPFQITCHFGNSLVLAFPLVFQGKSSSTFLSLKLLTRCYVSE